MGNKAATIGCFYLFCVIALLALPPILIHFTIISFILWLSSEFIQLTMLPLLLIYANFQGQAAEERSIETHDLVKESHGTLMDEFQELKDLHQELHVTVMELHNKVADVHGVVVGVDVDSSLGSEVDK